MIFKTLGRATQVLAIALVPMALGACQWSSNPSTQQPQYPPQGQVPPGQYPPQGQYPAQPGQPYPPPQPQVQPQPQPQAARPLLSPLVGSAAQQQELRMILQELINALPPQSQTLVRGIPLAFDPTSEVNAFAGCDDNGTPFMAATQGILDAVDAISQTKATDEMFGTQTYDAYCNAVLPGLVRSNGRAGLPAGIIPAQYGSDPRRWSRAREIFQEVLAFTFGHELAHHYLGHTGCARGQGGGSAGPDPAKLGRLASNAIPLINQFGEGQADTSGAYNALDAGRARRPQYEWNENGGIVLLDYFSRIERAAGGGGLGSLFNPLAVLKTHPNPLLRIPLLQQTARTWHQAHPR